MTGVLPDPCESPSWQYLERAAPYVAGGRRLKPRKWATRVSCPPTSVRSSPRRSRIHCVHEFVVRFATLQERCKSHRRVDRRAVRTANFRPVRQLYRNRIQTGYGGSLTSQRIARPPAAAARRPSQVASRMVTMCEIWQPDIQPGRSREHPDRGRDHANCCVVEVRGYVGGFPTAATAILAFSHTWDEYGHGPRVSDDR